MPATLQPLSLRELAPLQTSQIEEDALNSKLVTDAALRAIGETEHPRASDRLEPARVSSPNLAWEAIQAALAYERLSNEKLDGHLKTAEGYQKTIDSLLSLNEELTLNSDQETHTLSERAKTILSDLEIPSKDTLSKEELLQLKSNVSGKMDQCRSKVQTLVTTDIHKELQNASSINDIMKEMIKQNSRLLEAIIARYARQ